MKNLKKNRRTQKMRYVILILLAAIGLAAELRAATITYSIDFGATGTPATSGFTTMDANFLANTPNLSATGITGTGGSATLNLSILNMGAYNSGNAAEPLITDGIYTFGNQANPHTFTLSGLGAGDLVSLYAVAGWDGNGRGATITFGGSNTVAQFIGTPGTTPTLANFTLINPTAAVADGSGNVFGNILGHDGTANDEGQIGGFIIVVNQAVIPEPSTYALAAMGLAGLVFLRRRKV
jgi:hypothetical protein